LRQKGLQNLVNRKGRASKTIGCGDAFSPSPSETEQLVTSPKKERGIEHGENRPNQNKQAKNNNEISGMGNGFPLFVRGIVNQKQISQVLRRLRREKKKAYPASIQHLEEDLKEGSLVNPG